MSVLKDQGWSVKLHRRFEKVVKKIADRERRTVKVVVERAIEEYEKREGKT